MAIVKYTAQFQTSTQLHSFKATASTLTLKIYDLSKNRISKTTFLGSELMTASNISFPPPDRSMLLKILREKNLIPSDIKESDPPIPTLEDCLKEIEQIINKHPKNRQEDPIPTFALFKAENKQLANKHLRDAQFHMEREEFDPALDSYAEAFRYTQDWRYYERFLSSFEIMGGKDKALLSRLYLIQYQLQDKKIQEAIRNAERYNKSLLDWRNNRDPLVIPLLMKLYLYNA